MMKLLTLLWACLLAAPALASSSPAPSRLAGFVLDQQSSSLLPGQTNPRHPGEPWIRVGVGSQTLTLFDGDGTPRRHWVVSTAKNGVGEQFGSYQTPRGWHTVCDKIGADAAPDAIFYRRQDTGWRYSAELARENPDKDWILTRILWLCGAEPGFNQGELPDGTLVDSDQRGIYIHGGGAHVPFGTPTSKGCVRMTTPSVIDLFELVPTGTDVWIDVAG